MDRVIELELAAGGNVKLALPEPGDFASFYVLSMGFSGNMQFWGLVERLMAAAGRPVCSISETLRRQGIHLGSLTPSAKKQLLSLPGYGLGIVFAIEPAFEDEDIANRHKLLFLRDPRDVVLAGYRHSIQKAGGAPAPSFADYLASPSVASMAGRYERFVEFRRRGRNVALVRYEHALEGWSRIAADLVAILDLPIDPAAAAAIASTAPPVGDQLSIQGRPVEGASPAGMTEAETSELDAHFVDVLAALGYAPRIVASDRPYGVAGRPGKDAPSAKGGAPHAREGADGQRRLRPLPQIAEIYEPDPVLYLRLKPNKSAEMKVLGRQLVMDVDALGCRPVKGQPASGEKTLSVYGCSCTYGIGVSADETFCSRLQEMFPTWRIENHGVSAYGEAHNLIQLERHLRWERPEFVAFCWITHHMRRNVADITWVQTISEHAARPARGHIRQRPTPRAGLDSEGELTMGSLHMPRVDLVGLDCSDFTTNRHYLDLICFRLLERANALVTGYGGRFFVTTLNNRFSAMLAHKLTENGIPIVDASLSGDEYTCLPDDPHPNALAHGVYAERIRDYLLGVSTAQLAGQTGQRL